LAFEFLNTATKIGPGVDKNTPEKKRFFLFFELYFRKFGKMIITSLLYSLFLVPSVLIGFFGYFFATAAPFNMVGPALGIALMGPATCGVTYLLRQMSLERPVFIWHDFWSTLKKNFKQSILFSLLDSFLIFLIAVSLQFSTAVMGEGVFQYIILVFYCALAVFFLMMHYYVYLLMITLDLRITQILKNAAILAVAGLRTNLITTFFLFLLIGVPIMFIPDVYLTLIAVVFVPLFLASFIGFIIVFNSFPHIKRLLIDPYYEAHPQEKKNNPFGFETGDEDDEPVFTDLGTLEPKAKAYVPPQDRPGPGRTIS